MKTRRNTGGFTLLELALAVAVIAILSGVTTVNVVHYQRTLTQVELDGIAREIFIAAQNHLTMAESQGFMGVSNSNWGNKIEKETDDASEMYYYVADREQRNKTDTPNMLDLMLPFASVDETVLWDGSYVIRYQKNPALVLDVFYAPTTGNFHHTFDESEISPQWIQDYRGANDAEEEKYPQQWRGKYPEGTGSAIIGWYGVDEVAGKWVNKANPDDPVKEGKSLSPPTIKIVNAEQLYVEVTNPNVDVAHRETFQYARLNLEITSVDGERKCSIPLISETGQSVTDKRSYIIPDDEIYPYGFRVILDDVTQANTRFYMIMGDAGLYPGEDIIIRAVSYNNTELTNIATSANSTTNSLFASPIESTNTASIANFRHLENLDSNISNIASDAITDAKQAGDMDWTTFCTNIKKLRGLAEGNKINVWAEGNVKSKDDCYLPVTNPGTIVYDGGSHTISNVKINVPEDARHAGLFATLGHSSTVKDLELKNFDVQSSGDNAAAGVLAGVIEADSTVTNLKLLDFSVISSKSAAGGLAGVLKGSNVGGADIPGVLAYGVDSAVTGKTSVGGLIGEITGACTIEQSAAAVYVTSNSGDAGGLIGTVSADAVATVKDSYAGGHTEGGKYNQDTFNITATNGNAGGLIGSSAVTSTEKLKVENCYATTSVDGKTTAGGLIGDVAGGKIKNCYVTGYVKNDSTAGAFAGESTNTTFETSRYLSIITGELPGAGNIELSNVTAFDDSLEHYCDYALCTSDAVPYDGALGQYYGGKYLFKTISELHSGGTYTAEWMTTHYGDWPMPETQVVNTK